MVKKLGFDCCGEPNYAWIKDMTQKMGELEAISKAGWFKACKAKGETEARVVGSGTWALLHVRQTWRF